MTLDPSEISNHGYAGIVVLCKNDVLLIQRPNNEVPYGGMWSVPCRSRNRLESADKTARRACEDRLGVPLLQHNTLAHIGSVIDNGGVLHVYTVRFRKRIDKHITLQQSIAQYGWFPITNLPKNVEPTLRQLLSSIKLITE